MTNRFEGDLETFRQDFVLSTAELASSFPSLRFSKIDLKRPDYVSFLRSYVPEYEKISTFRDDKKKLELFISFSLLGRNVFGRYLDAAGGGYSYAGRLGAKRALLQDIEIRASVKARVGAEVEYVEGSLSHIPVADSALDAISTHHAFEHFQGTADSDFINEVQRVLTVGGMLALVPLFINREAVEITNHPSFANWSIDEDHRLFDAEATLPGKKSGHFARIYDMRTFQTRVLDKIDRTRFECSIVEPTFEGRPIPDPLLYEERSISNFNFPYRCFLLKRLH